MKKLQIRDIIEFDRKKYFGGAVQASWFYDTDNVYDITESYVFHGSKYHGVNSNETINNRYKLYDTASYTLELFKKVGETESNRFCMTIAGYGTGKSHLAVVLASLLSGHDKQLRGKAIQRIRSVDKNIATKIEEYTDENLVLVYNGMNNFNLDHETLRIARIALAQHGLDDSVFSEITKQYIQAENFVNNTFDLLKKKYEAMFSEVAVDELKSYIIKNITTDIVFDKINEIYKAFNGSYIQWEKGISAGDVISLLEKKYCRGTQKRFRRIIILFDEFGRYIEYTAANPMIAGESALQQIFEAIQNADGNIIFDGFIQSDLNAYLGRIDKTANIVRYVGRYENSDKYFLSSNFETILANLIIKKDLIMFKNIVENNIDGTYADFYKKMYTNFLRWNKKAREKSVWSNNELYTSVIAKGCYPLHPFAVWFLSNTSDWMQQRSTIAFTEKMFETVSSQEISSGKWIKYIYAVDIIDSELFDEMLNSETKGLVSSQHCMLYNEVMRKNGDKFNDAEKTVLKAILITNLMRFDFADKADCFLAIRYCSSLSEDNIITAISSLENNYGVISFDENVRRFDFLEETSGFNDYQRIFVRKKLMNLKYNGIIEYDDELINDIKLNTSEETSFSHEHQINSCEWRYEKILIDSSDVTSDKFNKWCYQVDNANDGESARGLLVYIYCGKNSDRNIEHICGLYRKYHIEKKAILIQLLIDSEGDLLDFLRSRKTINSFTMAEKERFENFITTEKRKITKIITAKIDSLINARNFVTEKGIVKSNDRVRNMCLIRFNDVYNNAVPFMFDGFERKVTPQAKKNLYELCTKMYDGSMTNTQMYQSFAPALKNRIQAVLLTNVPTSWQVLNSQYRLCEPQNNIVKKLYNDVIGKITIGEAVGIGALFNQYLKAPYGMNKYSLTLFIIYFICYNKSKLQVLRNNEPIRNSEFSNFVFHNEKKIYENITTLKIRINEKTNEDQIEEFCRIIIENRNVEYCGKYLSQLERVKFDSDGIESYRDKVATAELYAKDGKRMYKRIYTDGIDPLEKKLAEIKTEFNLLKALDIINKAVKKNSGDLIDEDSDYQYSEEYCQRVKNLIDDTMNLIDNNFREYIKELKCSISNISEFKKTYKKAGTILTKSGRKDFSEMLVERVGEAVAEAEMQQKYASSLNEIDKDIAFIGNVDDLNYAECEENINKLEKWKKFINMADDLSKTLKSVYSEKINSTIERLGTRKQNIISLADNLLVNAYSLAEKSLDSLISGLVRVWNMKPPVPYSEQITAFLADAKDISMISSDVKTGKVTLEQLKNEYDNRWKFTVCASVCDNLIKLLEEKQASERLEWIESNITKVNNSVGNMSAQDCIRWKNSHTEIPVFLNKDDIERLIQLTDKIDKRLKSLKIQGVVSLFNELSESEKKECLKILTS